MLAIILYDTVLTLDAEIAFIWKSNFRLVPLLYVTARYFAIIDILFNVIENFVGMSEQVSGF